MEAPDLIVGQGPGGPGRMDASPEERLIRVDVANPGQHPLV